MGGLVFVGGFSEGDEVFREREGEADFVFRDLSGVPVQLDEEEGGGLGRNGGVQDASEQGISLCCFCAEGAFDCLPV